jgi:hypothetical protein
MIFQELLVAHGLAWGCDAQKRMAQLVYVDTWRQRECSSPSFKQFLQIGIKQLLVFRWKHIAYIHKNICPLSRDSSVNIVTRPLAERPRKVIRFSAGAKDYLLHSIQNGCGSTQPTVHRYQVCFLEVKAAGACSWPHIYLLPRWMTRGTSLWFILRLCHYIDSITKNGRMCQEWWIGKYLEGRRCYLIEVLHRCLHEGTEGNHEKANSIEYSEQNSNPAPRNISLEELRELRMSVRPFMYSYLIKHGDKFTFT